MQLSPSAHRDTFCRDNLPPVSQWPEFHFDLAEVRYPERLNCAEALLDETIRHYGANRPALRTPNETWTYGDLRRHTNQIAQVLTEDLGLVPGNRVLLRGPNTPYLVACWLAVIKAGGVVVTTVPLLRAKELFPLIELTRPALALCDHRFADEMRTAAGDALPVLYYGDAGDADDLTVRASGKSGEFTAVDTAADDVVLLGPTSGTTGRPKATMHFHRDVLAIADTFSRHVLRPTPADVFTGTPPLGFTFGLGGLVVFPLRAGASALLLERTAPTDLADAIAEHGATVLFTAPTAYKAILNADRADSLKNLRRCVSAGEHLPLPVWQEFEQATGIRIINGIGGTEMLHVFISAADDEIRPGSTGRAVPGFRATILDADGSPVPDGTPGRLAAQGPTGCRYLSDERQRTYVQHGWNITGDVYIRDADGYYWFQARNDDMIISSGYNIAAPEVEEALLAHPDVAEAAVVGDPDPERGSIVHAFVVLREGVAAGEEKATELQKFVKGTIAPYKYPRAVTFCAELPKTVTGKIQRFRLRTTAN
ncbi:AMP-binding protein [Streptomyces chiangmaiensis]|uniref:AMP-binding protein n=1 Tax=Streptomyces chiangmaiensis TaxID=766497 RepID=A0ABU7FMB9_9ACTN|nr:AMP-binding protein [Streptomyces chiangmaiensis]MED7825275.1 AMP-binding protein [Streptomyces chiangmaiensis]